MEKSTLNPDVRGLVQSVLPGFPFAEHGERAVRAPAPIDRERARAACAPMGALSTVVVTEDPKKRRRTWYVVDPDPALARQYAAQGFDLFEGCKVLIDAEAMKPVALIDIDPASGSAETRAPCGFNPYWDLPPA